MQQVVQISNEAEFQNWLALRLAFERERLLRETVASESRNCANFKAIERKGSQELDRWGNRIDPDTTAS